MKVLVSKELNKKLPRLIGDDRKLLMQFIKTIEPEKNINQLEKIYRIVDSGIYEIKIGNMSIYCIMEEGILVLLDVSNTHQEHSNEDTISNLNPTFNHSINPTFNHNINPTFNHNINPTFNHNINPTFNHNINPTFNHNINPTFNYNINPIFNHNINPIFNHNINPIFNHSINPIFNHLINPIFNRSFSCPVYYDEKIKKIGFGVIINEQISIYYDSSMRQLFYVITANEEVKIIFEKNKYDGLIVKANEHVSVVFDRNNNYKGIIVQ